MNLLKDSELAIREMRKLVDQREEIRGDADLLVEHRAELFRSLNFRAYVLIETFVEALDREGDQ